MDKPPANQRQGATSSEADTERLPVKQDQAPGATAKPREYADVVDEASDESFPASDPPAH